MISPVTFKGAQNYKANLYALEVKSRFIDQTRANGYYKGYGSELTAYKAGTSGIVIGSGLFLVQARAVEIVLSEHVNIAFEEGKVGLIVARIETNPESNDDNCNIVVKTGLTISDITLTQEDVYQYGAENINKVYELPLYSFAMQNNTITNIVKLIKPIEEIKEISETALAANLLAQEANTVANTAKSKADTFESEIFNIKLRLNDLGFKTGTISGFSGVSSSLKKEGNYVIGHITFTPDKQTVGNIPTGFRPYAEKKTSIYVKDEIAELTFKKNGDIICSKYNTLSNEQTVIFGWDTTSGQNW